MTGVGMRFVRSLNELYRESNTGERDQFYRDRSGGTSVPGDTRVRVPVVIALKTLCPCDETRVSAFAITPLGCENKITKVPFHTRAHIHNRPESVISARSE